MTDEQFAELVAAIRSIAHGPTSGPTGLELVAMALAEKGEPSVSTSLGYIAEAIRDLATATGNLAGVLDHQLSRKGEP